MTHVVRVWIGHVDPAPAFAAGYWELLDDRERARADAYLDERDREQYAVAHGILRLLAGAALDVRPADLRWTLGDHGKPQLAPPWSGLHTSLSHSGEMVALAVSAERPVGIDVQHLIPRMDTVAMSMRFFPPDEAEYVAATDDIDVRADRFAHLWSRKEAVVKAIGGRLWPNLRMPVHGLDVVNCIEPPGSYRIVDVVVAAGYRAAVALHDTKPFVLEQISF